MLIKKRAYGQVNLIFKVLAIISQASQKTNQNKKNNNLFDHQLNLISITNYNRVYLF